MSKRSTLTALGTRNAFRATGRLIILTLLLCSALVARSASTISQQALRDEAMAKVASPGLPGNANCVVYLPDVTYSPDMLERAIHQALGWSFWRPLEYVSVYCERYMGPGGLVTLVRPAYRVDSRTGVKTNPHHESTWFSEIDGRFPTLTGEVAIPAAFAETYGLEPGDLLTLTPTRADSGNTGPAVFTVTGVYKPLGSGVIYSYLLSAMDQTKPPQANLLIGRLDSVAMSVIGTWRGAGRTETTELLDPAQLMGSLAQTVYSSQSSAMALGFALVGVAVLVVLLVALVERRREAAVYKMVGLNSLDTLRVLAVELLWALGIAVVLAAPIYWFVATRYVLDVHAVTAHILLLPFAASAAWTGLITAMGACYPFALASVGTPNQLLTDQKIYLFRRKQVLRGWAGVDSE